MKKERNDWTHVTSSELVSSIKLRYDPKKDSMKVDFEVDKCKREVSYKRKKNDKVLNRIPLDSDSLYLDDHSPLIEYDKIVAIDTNTKSNLSITGITIISWVDSKTYEYKVPFCIGYTDLQEPREKIGWLVGLEELYKRGYFKGSNKNLLVVDAYLDEIDAINSRESTVFRNYYLPPRFNLAYASADSGSEYLLNKLIRMSDKTASKILKYIEDANMNEIGVEINSEFYKKYSVIFGKQG